MHPYKQFLALFLFFAAGNMVMGQESENIRILSIPTSLNWEIRPLKYSVNGNQLFVSAGEKTDMFRDPNVTYNTDNAPKLMFTPADDFVLSASIEHGFVNKWDGGAIILKSDSLNWVKFCFEKDYTGAKRIVSVVTKNISDDCNSVEIKSNRVYYKMAKAGNVITLYYSETGANWFLVRHLQFDAKPGFTSRFPGPISYRKKM